MNLWIDIAREELQQVIGRIDCLILNDEELRQLTGAKTTVAAAREVLQHGPSIVVAKQGEYGAALFDEEGFFALPAYPLEAVIDPTGAGDSFAGGFLGYLASQDGDEIDHAALRRAMTYGSVMASFNVEAFGTERMQTLTPDEVTERVAELARVTRFDASPVPLRA